MAIHYASSLDRTFHALGDESRRRIVGALSRHGRLSAGELATLFDTSQPTVSRHLGVLERAGLLRRRKEGRRHMFSLDVAPLQEVDDWIVRHVAFWDKTLDRLGVFLDSRANRGEDDA